MGGALSSFTEPFQGPQGAENLFTMAGILAPRMRFSNWNQPWRHGEGEGVRNAMLMMGQLSQQGRLQREKSADLGLMLDALSGKRSDPMAALRGAKDPDFAAKFVPPLLKIQEQQRQDQIDQAAREKFLKPFAPQPAGVMTAAETGAAYDVTRLPQVEVADLLGPALANKEIAGLLTNPTFMGQLQNEQRIKAPVPVPKVGEEMKRQIDAAAKRGDWNEVARLEQITPQATAKGTAMGTGQGQAAVLPELERVAGGKKKAETIAEKEGLVTTQAYTDEQIAKLRDDQGKLMSQLTTINQTLGGFGMDAMGRLVPILEKKSEEERAKLKQQRTVIEKNYDNNESVIARQERRPPLTLGKRLDEQRRDEISRLASEVSQQGHYISPQEWERMVAERVKQLGLE